MAAPGDSTPGPGQASRTPDHEPPGGRRGDDLFAPVADTRVWRAVLTMYIAAGALFLVNNALGFLNVADAPVIARWQALTHLHSATIGWIVLAMIATAVWIFVGQRHAGDRLARFTTGLAWSAVLIFAAYILSFGLAFSQGGSYVNLLPVFGTAAALVIITTFLFSAVQLRRQHVVTATHLMLAGALLVASLGAVMGVLLGVRNAGGPDVLGDNWFAHPVSMDFFVVLGLMGLAEGLAAPRAARYRWHAVLQVSLIVSTVLIADVAFLAGAGDLAFMVAFPLLLAGFLTYFIRAAWRPLGVNPLQGGSAANIFWGGLGLIAFLVIFIVIPEEDTPRWMYIAFSHFLGIGAATNLILAAQSRAAAVPGGWIEPAAAWVMNLGLFAFVIGVYVADRADGALVMGVGVVVAVVAMVVRLMQTRARGPVLPDEPAAAKARAGEVAGP